MIKDMLMIDDLLQEMHLENYLAKMANPKFTKKQSNNFLKQNPKKQKEDVLNRLSSQQESYGRKFRWGRQSANQENQGGLTDQ